MAVLFILAFRTETLGLSTIICELNVNKHIPKLNTCCRPRNLHFLFKPVIYLNVDFTAQRQHLNYKDTLYCIMPVCISFFRCNVGPEVHCFKLKPGFCYFNVLQYEFMSESEEKQEEEKHRGVPGRKLRRVMTSKSRPKVTADSSQRFPQTKFKIPHTKCKC